MTIVMSQIGNFQKRGTQIAILPGKYSGSNKERQQGAYSKRLNNIGAAIR